MKKNHNDYWSKRVDEIFKWADRADIDFFAELAKIYADHSVDLQNDILAFYAKYAEDNKITLAEAKQRLRNVDLSDYQANAKRYRERTEDDPELLKRLNQQYTSTRATKLEALSLDLIYRTGVLRGVIASTFENHLRMLAKHSYSRIMGGLSDSTLNEPALKKLLATPFDGYNYSEQLWGNTDNLAKDLKKTLERGFVHGLNPREMAREMNKRYDVARHRVETLIRTDGTMIINSSIAQRYMDAGLKGYRILVHLDERTTEICRGHAAENKLYLLSEYKPGVTAPPFHFNCRSGIVPDDDELMEDVDSENNKKYNQDMKNMKDYMAQSKLFVAEDKQRIYRIRAKKQYGTEYDIWLEGGSKSDRDAFSLLDKTLKNLNVSKGPTFVIANASKLNNGLAAYDYKNKILYISNKLSSEKITKDLLSDGFFAAKNYEQLLIHELTHMEHWDSAERLYNSRPKSYNNIEEAKQVLDSRLVSYVKMQVSYSPLYIYDVSMNAQNAYSIGNINELVADVNVKKDSINDRELLRLVKEVLGDVGGDGYAK